jgi:hypothetical protein
MATSTCRCMSCQPPLLDMEEGSMLSSIPCVPHSTVSWTGLMGSQYRKKNFYRKNEQKPRYNLLDDCSKMDLTLKDQKC